MTMHQRLCCVSAFESNLLNSFCWTILASVEFKRPCSHELGQISSKIYADVGTFAQWTGLRDGLCCQILAAFPDSFHIDVSKIFIYASKPAGKEGICCFVSLGRLDIQITESDSFMINKFPALFSQVTNTYRG